MKKEMRPWYGLLSFTAGGAVASKLWLLWAILTIDTTGDWAGDYWFPSAFIGGVLGLLVFLIFVKVEP